jgi:hypothetical protein
MGDAAGVGTAGSRGLGVESVADGKAPATGSDRVGAADIASACFVGLAGGVVPMHPAIGMHRIKDTTLRARIPRST